MCHDDDDEAPTSGIEAEDFDRTDSDSAYGAPSVASLTETLSSDIVRGVSEYGRTYAAYGREEYGLPIDEAELDRIDMSHEKYKMLLGNQTFLSPVGKNPQRILDLGTGTGIWAIEAAELYPSADVCGVDIAPTQPKWVPPNLRFEIDDIEQNWTWQHHNFDFIFARDLLLSIRDWPKLVHQCYDNIKPGGWVELQSVHPKLLCDDTSTPYSSGLMEFSRLALSASEACGTPLSDCIRYKEYLTAAGFQDVTETRFKLPSSPWPRDPRLKLIGAFEIHNLLNGLSGMSLRMFSRAWGWSPEQTEVFLVNVRKDLRNLRYHTYYEFLVVRGRKPLDDMRM
ncbi:methyltransferase domain-containing protein [Phlyctema vagabunda]|uniref:Methyltransferase domain-containing protein n=1 Tax=Phlyctema vagabunda TaxID=108571 RepID=A0ABR4PHF8_9HELO